MFEYIISAVKLYKSSIFTLILFIVLGAILLFILLFFILTHQSALANNQSVTRRFLLSCFNVLNRFLLIPYDPLSTALFNVFSVLKTFLHSYSYKYKLPWTMIIGAEDTGKTEMLKALKIYNPLDPVISRDQSCIWNFYSPGVILDIAGDLVCSEEDETLKSNDERWMSLLQLLNNHRGYLPVDNMAVCISSEDLIKEEEEKNISKAEILFDKILQAKRAFGLNLPIYIIFTKLDAVEGFEEFAEQLTEEEREDIFGWSSPYSIHTQPTDWYEEMSKDVLARLEYIIDRIMSKEHKEADCDSLSKIVMFGKRFKEISETMELILKQLSHTGYDTNLFIRGVYFTGEYEERTIFATKLFEEKIFVERGIAERFSPGMFATNTLLKTVQISALAAALAGTASLTYQYNALWYAARDRKLPLANLQIMLASQKYRTAITSQVFETESSTYFAALKDAYSSQYFSWLYPVSYFAQLDQSVEQALVIGCQRVILDRIHQEFESVMKEFVQLELSTNKAAYAKNQCYNQESVVAKDFLGFISKVYKFKKLDTYIQRLPLDANMHHLKEIVLQLFNEDIYIMPDQMGVYKTAMNQTYIKPIIWAQYKKEIQKAFEEKSANFIKYMLTPEQACACILDLKKDMEDLKDNKGDLVGLKDHLNMSINLLNSMLETFNRYDNAEYRLGDNWKEFKDQLKEVRELLGTETVEHFEHNLQESFLDLKNFILMQNLPILGFIVGQNEFQQQMLDSKMYELMGLLNVLAVQGIADLKKSEHVDQITLNMNVQKFADAIMSIDTFQDLAQKQVYLMGDNRVFYDATLNALVQKMDKTLFISKQFSAPLNVEQVQACEGYIKRLLNFLHIQKNKQCIDFMHKFYTTLLSMINSNIQDAYDLLHSKDFYTAVNLPITANGLPKSQVQDHCKVQLRQIRNIMDTVMPYLDIAQSIRDMLPTAKLDPILEDMLYIRRQLQNFDNNEGDIILLHNNIESILTSRTMLYDVSHTAWVGSDGIFSEAFSRFIQTAEAICDKIKYTTYATDFAVLSDFFNARLAGKFPFSGDVDGLEADVIDVIDFFSLLDDFNKKYPEKVSAVYDLQSLKEFKEFVNTANKCRPWLEILAKNLQTNYMLGIDTWIRYGSEQNVSQLGQWLLSFDAQTVDFRTRNTQLPYIQYMRVDNTLTLHEKSELSFEKDNKTITVTYTGAWAVLKMIRAHSGVNSDMHVIVDLYEKHETKPTKQLKCALKFKLMRGSNETAWYNPPVFAPEPNNVFNPNSGF